MIKQNSLSFGDPEQGKKKRFFSPHTPEGERIIQVAIESWLHYYDLKVWKPEDALRDDIIELIDIYGPYLMGDQSRKPPQFINEETIHRIIGPLVLARGLLQNDKSAIDKVEGLCARFLNENQHYLPINFDSSACIERSIALIQEILTDDSHEFVELIPPMEDMVEQCVSQEIIISLNQLGISPPEELIKDLNDQKSTQEALMTVLTQLRIAHDRVWLLKNSPGYCNCIKQSLLLLKTDQLLLLSLGYYENQRVPSIDIFEALTDTGNQYTQRKTEIGRDNIDRNLHYILRTALPHRLAQEFAVSLDKIIAMNEKNTLKHTINPYALYFVDNSGVIPCANQRKLLEYCEEGIGSTKGQLVSEGLIKLCQALAPEKDI